MEISCFTFLRNAGMLGYPFLESIKSALPLCDEFIVNVGKSEDDTLEQVKGIQSPKIRIIESQWNEKMLTRGYVYGQQKSIAHYNCNGDWALYIEADEVLHEEDIPKIRESMQRHLNNRKVEALAFDFIHFYGNHLTYAWSPGWYRREVRAIKNSLRAYSPDGLFFIILDSNKKGRYPDAALSNAKIYHYGWVRREEQMDEKVKRVKKYFGGAQGKTDYSDIDPMVLKEFRGTHPAVMQGWLPKGIEAVYTANPLHILTKREKRHRLAMKIEKMFGLELSKKHFRLLKNP